MKAVRIIIALLLGLGPFVCFTIIGLSVFSSSQDLSGIIGAAAITLLGLYIAYWTVKISLKMGIVKFTSIAFASPDLDNLD